MEGRWAKLAVRAHRMGYLDFSQISRYKSRSIIRESIVLKDIEDERSAELFSLRAVLTSIIVDDNGAASQANLGEYLSINFPWLRAGKQEQQTQQSEVDRLIEMYKKYQEIKENE